MSNALPRLLAHPLAVVLHIFGQTLGIAIELSALRAGVNRRHILKLRRDLNHRLADHHRDRVQVRAIGRQPEALRLQRNGAAARKRIIDRWQLATAALKYFRACFPQHFLVGGIFPLYQPLDDAEQTLALGLLLLMRGELVRMAGRIIHQLRKQHRPTSRQRPPCPPEVKRGRVPMPDRLLPRRRLIDRFQRNSDLDQFLFIGLRRGHWKIPIFITIKCRSHKARSCGHEPALPAFGERRGNRPAPFHRRVSNGW